MRIIGLVIVAVVLWGAPVSAANLINELALYNKVLVRFSETANKCNLTDTSLFEKHTEVGLAKLGLKKSEESRIVAVVNVAANGFGMLNSQCSTTVSLNLQTTLHGSQIVTENPEARKILDYVGDFPISLYRFGMFGVQAQSQPSAGGKSTATRDAVLLMIDEILENLGKMRK